MKVIILGAGTGTRMSKYTKNKPKCLIHFLGKSLLERQICILKNCGIKDISIVAGYQENKINIPNTKKYINVDFASNNMVASLFFAEKELNGEILIAYSDILYEKKIIKKIMRSRADIGVAVDRDYFEYWQARNGNLMEDMESLVVENDNIRELGKPCKIEKAKMRYVGLIKLSKKGVAIFKKIYWANHKKFFNSEIEWFGSKSFKKAYMTSLLQVVIDSGYKVTPILINRGWLEFDTAKDYENYLEWEKNGTLKKFIRL